MEEYKITGGLYIVIDPSMDLDKVMEKLEWALSAGGALVQIWDNWPKGIDRRYFVHEVSALCTFYDVPLLINNDWHLANSTSVNGVHFDNIPDNWEEVKMELKSPCLVGITCNNDLSTVRWAQENQIDYISFCSMFPSSTSNSCELVDFATVQEARKLVNIPVFLAGGIQLDTMHKIQDLDYDGIAIVSGIMTSDDPAKAAEQYVEILENKKRLKIDLAKKLE